MKLFVKIIPFVIVAGLLVYVPAVRIFRRESIKKVALVAKLLLVCWMLPAQTYLDNYVLLAPESAVPDIRFDSVTVKNDSIFIYRSWETKTWVMSGEERHDYADRLIYAYDRKQKQIVFVRREEAQKQWIERERIEKYYETKWIWKQ